MVERETFFFAAVDSVGFEEEEAWKCLGVVLEGPVRADEVELNAEGTRGAVDGDLVGCWVERGGV